MVITCILSAAEVIVRTTKRGCLKKVASFYSGNGTRMTRKKTDER